MSLFKARDWWTSKVGENEEFDLGCMCVANLDNSNSPNAEKVAVGSFAGILRVYNTQNVPENYKPEHLLLEQNLASPILQLACGKFVSVLNKLALAVLHPRRLSVYTLTSTAGAVEHGAQYKLNLVYQHNLGRTSFNMCCGPFGRIPDKDFICVQSMDGSLSVYEQESFSFTRFLPDSLLPGPLGYIAQTDSFVTVSSCRQVECYKFQVLAVATDTKTKEESQNLKSGKRVASDWTLVIGEEALQIEVVSMLDVPLSILILGERNVYCVNEYGKLRYMKKLDYTPRCMKVYGKDNGAIRYLVASDTKTLMVYRDTVLKWAAQLLYAPVQLDICYVKSEPGGIAALEERGNLGVHYLGTDPAMMVIPSSQYRETKYDEWQSEIKKYQKIIRDKSSLQGVLPTKGGEDDISISVHVPSSLDVSTKAHDVEFNDPDPVPSITVKVELKAKIMTSNVKLFIHVSQPLATPQMDFEYPSVGPNHPASVSVPIYVKYNYLLSTLQVDVSVNYTGSTGAPRVSQSKCTLPLNLIIKPVPPVKTALYKVTVDANKPPVNLNDLFPDLLGMNSGGQGLALGFQFYGGPVITMLASKTSQRYRLQSDSFAAMWLLSKALVDRLHQHFGPKSGLQCSFTGSLPLQEYFECVDAHFEYRLHSIKYKDLLEQKAAQFRAIQRRLLTRFKDKTPAPLAYLDTLLEGTYRQLVALVEHAEDNRKTLYRAATNLSSATYLVNFLVKLSCDLNSADYGVLQSVITPNVLDVGDQGWEEMVDTALTHQLRTTLSKTVKDQTVNMEMVAMDTSTGKLKKHIALFVERLAKGAKLVDTVDEDKTKSSTSSKVLDKRNIAEPFREDSTLGVAETPIGTKLGEKISPRQSKHTSNLLQNGSSQAPVAGSAASMSQLPPLTPTQLKPLRSRAEVPDLDELMNEPIGSGDL